MTQADVELTLVVCSAPAQRLQHRSYRHAWLVRAEMGMDRSRRRPKILAHDGVTGLPHGFTGLTLTVTVTFSVCWIM